MLRVGGGGKALPLGTPGTPLPRNWAEYAIARVEKTLLFWPGYWARHSAAKKLRDQIVQALSSQASGAHLMPGVTGGAKELLLPGCLMKREAAQLERRALLLCETQWIISQELEKTKARQRWLTQYPAAAGLPGASGGEATSATKAARRLDAPQPAMETTGRSAEKKLMRRAVSAPSSQASDCCILQQVSGGVEQGPMRTPRKRPRAYWGLDAATRLERELEPTAKRLPRQPAFEAGSAEKASKRPMLPQTAKGAKQARNLLAHLGH